MAISGLIDKGRFYLPNLQIDDFGANVEPPSRRGYRHAALDELVEAHRLLEFFERDGFVPTESMEDSFFELRRAFTDAVINEIKVGLHQAFFAGITNRQLELCP